METFEMYRHDETPILSYEAIAPSTLIADTLSLLLTRHTAAASDGDAAKWEEWQGIQLDKLKNDFDPSE